MKINEYKDAINEIIGMERKIREIKTLHSLSKIDTEEAKNRIKGLEEDIRKTAEKLPEHEKELFLHRRESPYYGRGG